jgi:hypothetical protein
MSDVSIAPPPAAPSSTPAAPATPAPASNEAVINQNPVNAPAPLGSQAPEKPAGDNDRGKARPEHRRESIKRAFDKANADDKPKTAKRGMGDNNPPEAMEREKPKVLPQHREQGRFARSPDGQTGMPMGTPGHAQPAQPGQQPGQPARQLPEGTPYRDPPQRMSERGKAEWAAAPESVRGEVHRMQQEFEGAYRKYRGDSAEMDTIRNFHQMAAQQGTTLQKALTNYVGMEQKLRSDLVGGLDVIVNNLNLRTADGRKITLPDVAYHILNQTPDQHKMVQTQNSQQAMSQQIGQLHQIVGTLAQNVQQMHHKEVFKDTRSGVDQFADTHPGFDELGDLIQQEVELGFDLETAYQRAYRLRPPQAAQTRSTPAQTRSNKSISGAPSGGPSNGQPRKSDIKIGRRDAISNAFKRVNGSV